MRAKQIAILPPNEHGLLLYYLKIDHSNLQFVTVVSVLVDREWKTENTGSVFVNLKKTSPIMSCYHV